ncbi:Hypothetical protein BHY_1038 (plasmid) [Borrelia nietonii YOR]|uniref:Uncharacterized protein n=1 Tax=Borrelia nietonii YOR TaxID=1293576 RepID=W5SA58_9SPIR|nr:hypothetical protein [Borrelia nietonii]AHH03989.1 Hypothetical protein BHY_1038 [Borrelia nietonii YOR]UPA09827.1 hypothetical protein bhYOR_001134 [Borrelia nietonii YOR]
MKRMCVMLCALELMMGCSLGDEAKIGSFVSDVVKRARVNRSTSGLTHVDSVFDHVSGGTSDTKTPVEQIYEKLKNRVEEYRRTFRTVRFKFKQDQHQFSIPIFEKFIKLNEAKWDMIYAALGYDVNIIRKLETMMSKITLQELDDKLKSASGVVFCLSNRLYAVTYYFKSVLVDHLNDVSLEQLSLIKSEEDLTKLYDTLKILSDLMSKFIAQSKIVIKKAAKFENDNEAMLNEFVEMLSFERPVGKLILGIIQIGRGIQEFVDGKDEEVDEKDLY